MTFIGKTGPRSVPLSPAAVAVFERCAKGKLPNAPLFPADDGKPWPHSGWDGPLKVVIKAAKLPAATVLYSLRHAAITEMLRAGMSTLDVARLTGTSLAMLEKHYGHLGGRRCSRAAGRRGVRMKKRDPWPPREPKYITLLRGQVARGLNHQPQTKQDRAHHEIAAYLREWDNSEKNVRSRKRFEDELRGLLGCGSRILRHEPIHRGGRGTSAAWYRERPRGRTQTD